ncbi:hypothetical protein CEXT_550021 [Caerostris extrusa]|uniref:Uncharacterized protein n=1 Tax=Caerostris extrusa TaxID=172846 RepID=A0AAV4X1B5_CAEEX|nr:hypothetical protein CEXT_550021 [Caerostris extrusa]
MRFRNFELPNLEIKTSLPAKLDENYKKYGREEKFSSAHCSSMSRTRPCVRSHSVQIRDSAPTRGFELHEAPSVVSQLIHSLR